MCLSVAPVLLIDGTEEGQHCEPSDYTGKIIVTIAVNEKLWEDEICHIKKTEGWRTPLGGKLLPSQCSMGQRAMQQESKGHW